VLENVNGDFSSELEYRSIKHFLLFARSKESFVQLLHLGGVSELGVNDFIFSSGELSSGGLLHGSDGVTVKERKVFVNEREVLDGVLQAEVTE
jgi:hypothetical protein